MRGSPDAKSSNSQKIRALPLTSGPPETKRTLAPESGASQEPLVVQPGHRRRAACGRPPQARAALNRWGRPVQRQIALRPRQLFLYPEIAARLGGDQAITAFARGEEERVGIDGLFARHRTLRCKSTFPLARVDMAGRRGGCRPYFSKATQTPSQATGGGVWRKIRMRSRNARPGPSSGASFRHSPKACSAPSQSCAR